MVKLLLAALLLISTPLAVQAAPEGTSSAPTLEKIADNVWIHKSWRRIETWGLVLSQGLVVQTGNGVLLIDTAWNDADTDELLRLIESETGAAPKLAIATHAHGDKMGGMGTLHAYEIATIAHSLSNEVAPSRGLIPAKTSLHLKKGERHAQSASNGAVPFEVFYPGAGHSGDNIVFYYAPAKVLFGGCLIRPGESHNLGNTADGDVGHWAEAARSVAAAFPDAEIIIPSHGPMGGRALLDHTVALATKAAAEQ